jgi:hypothetical protein
MIWTIANARRRFSEVIRAASKEPQAIYNRDTLVAGVVDAKLLKVFLEWLENREKPTIAEAFEELRELACHEDWSFPEPDRSDREEPSFEPEGF